MITVKDNYFLRELYPSLDKWDIDYDLMKEKISNYKFSTSNIENCLLNLESIYTDLDKLHTYILLKVELNIKSNENKDRLREIEHLYTIIYDKTDALNNYIGNNLSKIISKVSTNPTLYKFKTYYEKMFSHRESEDFLENIYHQLDLENKYESLLYQSDFLCKINYNQNNITIKHSELLTALNNNDRMFRKSVYENAVKYLARRADDFAFIVNIFYQIKNANSLRLGYQSFSEQVLNECIFQITQEQFKEQVSEVKRLSKEILDVKRILLGYSEISYHDMYYTTNIDSYITIEMAELIIKDALHVFGKDYIDVVDRVFKEKWVHFDSDSSVNKKFGARSYSSYSSHPYIIMHWKYDLESLFTLVHELGGAIAQYFAQKSGSILYSELSILKVEFSSFINEIILINHLLYINNYNLNTDSLKLKLLDLLKDSYVIPFEYVTILDVLSSKAREGTLTTNKINGYYDATIKSFRDFEHFKNFDMNKYNWVKGHEGLNLDYNLQYICAFLFAFNASQHEQNFENISSLFEYGEKISDEEFFETLICTMDFEILNQFTLKKIKDMLINLSGAC